MGSSSVDDLDSPLSHPASPSPSRHRSDHRSRSRSHSDSRSRSPTQSLYPRSRPEDNHHFQSRSNSRFLSRNHDHSGFSMPGTSRYHSGSQQGSDYPPYYPTHHQSPSVFEQHQPLASHPLHPALLPAHLQPGPSHTALAYHDVELIVRLEKLERENLDFRQTLAKISIQLEQLSSAPPAKAAPSGVDTVRARLKRAVDEAVSPVESLLSGEELGHDCIRAEEDFPKLKFFTIGQWNKWKNSNQQATRIGDKCVRGKTKSSQGENHTAHFIERSDGTTADGNYVNDARRFCREFIALVQNAGYSLPPSWGQADLWLQELFYSALRRKFTLFQLCHNNSKGYTLMKQAFYEGFVRKAAKGKKSAGKAVNLNDAPYTIKTADDLADSTLLDLASQSVLSKRAAGEDVVDEHPAKRACTDGEHVEQPRGENDPSPSTSVASASNSSKGKGRAAPNLLSLLQPSLTALHLEPRPAASSPSSTMPASASSSSLSIASTTDTSSSLMPAVSPEPSPTSAHASEPSPTSMISPELSPTSVSAPALSPTSARALDSSLTSARAPESSLPSTVSPEHPPTSPRAPDPLSSNLSTVLPRPSSPSPSTPAPVFVDAAAPPTETTKQTSAAAPTKCPPRARARRKAEAWPPPEDQNGPKWAYARKWYAESGGTEDAFEAHYRDLSAAEKRKISREYGPQSTYLAPVGLQRTVKT